MNRTRIATIFGAVLLSLGTSSALALVQAGPAQGQASFAYVCDITEVPDEEAGLGVFNCEPRGGAPANGAILQEFRILSRVLGPDLECYGGGVALTPLEVTGRQCVII